VVDADCGAGVEESEGERSEFEFSEVGSAAAATAAFAAVASVSRQARTSLLVMRRVSSPTVETTASMAAGGSAARARSVTASRSAL